VSRELARLRGRRPLGVPEVVQPIGEPLRRKPLSAVNVERPRQHARQRAHTLALQARVDDAREHHVVVRGDRDGREKRQADHERKCQPEAAPPRASGRWRRRCRRVS
jgi:hypothetical protein